jgi:hypothetical protein
LVVRLDEPPKSDDNWYTVQAEPYGPGAPLLVGTIHMKGGRGLLVTSVPASVGKMRGIRVFDKHGDTAYQVTFT